MEKQKTIEAVMSSASVIPVVTVNDPRTAVKLARALVKGGVPSIEVTLRTPRAIECIAAIASEVEGALTGAGTVIEASQISKVERAGARFLVSPGFSPRLLDAADDCAVPLLPGAVTASEMMTLGERGYTRLKFFPAAAAGGAALLISIHAPLPQFIFCPTGGISPANAGDYLSLPNVACVGGSWLAPASLVDEGRWDEITALARVTTALKAGRPA
ncbi:MAG: bifunctional 4-hydroxy-2-oxoglutarate aldolase/2-dehydro-3-deoxy-phosphogluconate aldolase [Rhizobiaceae bacterium]